MPLADMSPSGSVPEPLYSGLPTADASLSPNSIEETPDVPLLSKSFVKSPIIPNCNPYLFSTGRITGKEPGGSSP